MTEKITFKDAIQKFIHVGDVFFRGHYNDNALNIFNELTEADQKALLRGLHQVYFLIGKGDLVPETNSHSPKRAATEAPDPVVATSMTASSTFIIIMLLVFIFVLVALFITIGLDPSPNSAFKKLVQIIGFIF